ncbi:MAG: DUF1330 domain-containing protein [Rhodospirillaceae bacterium]
MSQPGYLLFLGHSLDMEKMGRYSAAVSPVYKQYRATYVGIGGPGHGTELLEGAWFDHSIVLARFPASEDVVRFWQSPESAEVRKLREGGGTFQAYSLAGENAEPPKGQPAYLISIYRPFDIEAYAAAAKAEAEMLERRGLYYLARATDQQTQSLEGQAVAFNFSIIACPTQPAATTLWNDPGYAQIRADRAKTAGVNTFLMAGMPQKG